MDLFQICCHEAGHVLMAKWLGLPVRSVEISLEGGHTSVSSPDIEVYNMSKDWMDWKNSFSKPWEYDNYVSEALRTHEVLNAMVDVYIAGWASVETCLRHRYSFVERLTFPREMTSHRIGVGFRGADEDLNRVLRLFGVNRSDVIARMADSPGGRIRVPHIGDPFYDSYKLTHPPHTIARSFCRFGSFLSRLTGNSWLSYDLDKKERELDPFFQEMMMSSARMENDLRYDADYHLFKALRREFERRAERIRARFSERRALATLIELALAFLKKQDVSGLLIDIILTRVAITKSFHWNILPFRVPVVWTDLAKIEGIGQTTNQRH